MGASLTGFGTGANQSIWLGNDPNQANSDFLSRLRTYDPDARYVSGGVGDNGQERWNLQVDPSKLPQPKDKDPLQGNMPVISSGAMEVGKDFNKDSILDKTRIYNDPIYGNWTPGQNAPQKTEWQDKLGMGLVGAGGAAILGAGLGPLFSGVGGGQLGNLFGGALGKGISSNVINMLMSGGQAKFNPMGLLSSLGSGALNMVPGMGQLGQLYNYGKTAYGLYNQFGGR